MAKGDLINGLKAALRSTERYRDNFSDGSSYSTAENTLEKRLQRSMKQGSISRVTPRSIVALAELGASRKGLAFLASVRNSEQLKLAQANEAMLADQLAFQAGMQKIDLSASRSVVHAAEQTARHQLLMGTNQAGLQQVQILTRGVSQRSRELID